MQQSNPFTPNKNGKRTYGAKQINLTNATFEGLFKLQNSENKIDTYCRWSSELTKLVQLPPS